MCHLQLMKQYSGDDMRVLKNVGQVFSVIREGQRFSRLVNLTDSQLAARGLEREQMVRNFVDIAKLR